MEHEVLKKLIKWAVWPSIVALNLTIMALVATYYLYMNPDLKFFQAEKAVKSDAMTAKENLEIIGGIHVATGLKDGDGLQAVITNCTGCHSAKLITQNRMSSERWQHTIQWMQRTENLWDLGANEAIIVNYLTTNYAPAKKGRRQALKDIEWYTLEIKN